MQDAQKDQTSHPPNPGAPRRAFAQARPQRVKQAEVEVKVEDKRRSDSLYLNLGLSLNLLRTGGFFQHPDTSLAERIAQCGNSPPFLP
jgi:hypothetical protein